MCSRYARWTDVEEMDDLGDVGLPPEPVPITYNAAPQSMQPIVRLSHEGKRKVVMARWGLIPYWAKDTKAANRMINARSEELAGKPAFREPLKTKRCLIPADCFYEWQTLGAKHKQPHAIGMKNGAPFAFAGLWDRWRSPDGIIVESFTITTTAPNDLMKPFHDRMPCILEHEDYGGWLHAGDPAPLLRSYPAEKMREWLVDPAVGNVRNDSPDLIKELKKVTGANLNLFL